MENNKKKSIPSGEVFGLSNLQTRIKARKFKWLDAGNTVDYLKIKKKIKSKKNILEKGGEKIWFVENKVIKYFKDKSLISKRVKRASILKKFVPKIIEHKKNMYSYRMEEGKVFSEVKSNKVFINLLSHIKRFHKTTHQVNKKKYDKICEIFYKKKTTQRIIDFEKKFKIKDSCASLNSVKTRKIRDILKLINWKDLVRGKYSNFHGDLHFENILYSRKNKKFIFLDWRQDFGGNLKYGDIYYDLAKLMHGLIVSHKQVQNNNYKINWRKKNINFSIKSEKIYKKYIFNYKKWILKNNFDLQRINILTGLIYLNIAALHHYPYSLFLYAAGKKILTDIVLYKKNDIEL